MKTKIWLLLIGSLFLTHSFAQNVPGPFDGNSFSDLNDTRNKLNIEIPDLQNQIAQIYTDLPSLISDSAYYSYYLSFYTSKIGDIPANKDSSLFHDSLLIWRQQKSVLANQLRQINFSINDARNKSRQKDSLNTLLDSKKKQLMNAEYKINQLMIPKISQQNFMFWASIAFVILMCILLGTFFYVVSRDPITRQKIFGSDSGIQFIALFSIIIAIILFGLTGVLEGKELSALLGSVAGYILGKVRFTGDTQNGNAGN
jgi:hypothetical protein